MPFAAKFSENVAIGGFTFKGEKNVESDAMVSADVTKAAAKTGTLSLRTDADTGELTMGASHGILTGDRLDIYWTEGGVFGHRRGVTVGTVSGTTVPIDLGAGDNLPTQGETIYASVPSEEAFVCDGDNVQALALYSAKKGLIVLASSGDAELAYALIEASGNDVSYLWNVLSGVTNPLAGDSVAKVFFSHMDPSNTAQMRAVAMYN